MINSNAPQQRDRVISDLWVEGVFLRAQGGAGLPDCWRVTIGETDDMNVTAALLKRWKAGEKT